MTGLSREDLKAVLDEVFEERSRIDSEKHGEHHAWIAMQIEKEKEKLLRWKEYRAVITAVRKRALEFSLYFALYALATRIMTGHWPNWPDSFPGN